MSSKRDNDPVNYGDFMNFKVSVERRLTAVETQQMGMKEDINELKKTIKDLTEKMEENNQMISTKIDGLRNLLQTIQNKTQTAVSANWKWLAALIGSILGSVLLSTYLTWLLRLMVGA